MKYDLTDLRLFLAVAETQNMTHGASRIHLALHRPATAFVSSKKLWERHCLNGMRAALASHAPAKCCYGTPAKSSHNWSKCTPTLPLMAAAFVATVSLWANTHATHSYLPDDLAGFLRSHPQVSISLEEHNSPEIVMAVARGDVDIGVVAGHIDGVEVELIPYRADRLVLIVPAGHPLNAMTGVRFADVIDYPFVMLNAGSAIHTFTMNAAAALGTPSQRPHPGAQFRGGLPDGRQRRRGRPRSPQRCTHRRYTPEPADDCRARRKLGATRSADLHPAPQRPVGICRPACRNLAGEGRCAGPCLRKECRLDPVGCHVE